MRTLAIVLLVLLLPLTLVSQDKPSVTAPEAPPVLTELQRAQFQTLVARFDAAQLKLQNAQLELALLAGERDKFVAAVAKPGWVFDPTRGEFVKLPPVEKK